MIKLQTVKQHLSQFAFRALFIDALGWDRATGEVPVTVHGTSYTLHLVASKMGRGVYVCPLDVIPEDAERKAIAMALKKVQEKHLLIFRDHQKTKQAWLYLARERGADGKIQTRPVTHTYAPGHQNGRGRQTGEPLAQLLVKLEITFAEEDNLTGLDIDEKVAALNVDRVTKRFYMAFQVKHKQLAEQIIGLDDTQREAYASLILNRLMFTYFIQKKGFLAINGISDYDYMRSQLEKLPSTVGFYSFYRSFLLKFFHDGLGGRVTERSAQVKQLIGEVPYLNGGLFEEHSIEKTHRETLDMPDASFEMIFDFFDAYQWNLNTTGNGPDDEINPDVLGYIFEKYINQKQMGAYYTKEDITEYISKNTIIPFLFDRAQRDCAIAFDGEASVWLLLQADPDRYIHEAVRRGTAIADDDLPPEIAAGISDVSKRGQWNQSAPVMYIYTATNEEIPFALPTETWREMMARRQRYSEIKEKLIAGEITAINNLITYNLDIIQFAKDVIQNCEGPDLLKAFYRAITSITVLDPTCGSGAFLFAALNILEPLYMACLEMMEQFVCEDDKRLDDDQSMTSRRYENTFRVWLDEANAHPSRLYFVYKSIILRNLYGVDIMDEAIEIAKLRLFLKLVAQTETAKALEPLPDIDFNIRVGNTLVGYTNENEVRIAINQRLIGNGNENGNILANIREAAENLDKALIQFRVQQIMYDSTIKLDDKKKLCQDLKNLNEKLDEYLAWEHAISITNIEQYINWRKNHCPFHWYSQFYNVMKNGGFDVIIGNPPYLEYKKVKDIYIVKGLSTLNTSNLYSFCAERSHKILQSVGFVSLIVPLSLFSTPNMLVAQDYIKINSNSIWISYFSNRPDQLFEGSQNFLAIYISKKGSQNEMYTTRLQRWSSEQRSLLFNTINYVFISKLHYPIYAFPKFESPLENNIAQKLFVNSTKLSTISSAKVISDKHFTYCYGGIYWTKARNFDSSIIKNGKRDISTADRVVYVLPNTISPIVCVAILNSSLHYWFWCNFSDCRNKTYQVILDLPIPLFSLREETRIEQLGARLMTDYQTNKVRKLRRSKNGVTEFDEFYPRMSKFIIDEIDNVLAEHYKFTDVELDFITNYDFKYRMGRDMENEGDLESTYETPDDL